MKKLLSFCIVAILSTVYVNAQSILLSWDGAVLEDTVTVWVDPYSTESTVFHAVATNNTDADMAVNVLRTNVDTIAGTINSFCWADLCYPPFLDLSGHSVFLAAGASSEDLNFKGEFFAQENLGASLVKYKFFNVDNEEEFVEVVVRYISSPAGIEVDYADNISMSNAYPNPAHSAFKLDYSFDMRFNTATIKVVNLLGSIVKVVELDQNSNSVSVDVSDLKAGVYFYSVLVNNEIFQTKKLVVR